MALLKDTIVSGSLRATDTIYSTTNQFQTLRIPTSSNGTTYGLGSNGQLLSSNGTSVYWSSPIELIISTNTADSSMLTGNSIDYTLTDGKIIIYKTIYNISAGSQSVQITTANGTNTIYTLYLTENTASTDSFPAGSFLLLLFYNNAFYILNPQI